jgi:hypothetical protein
MKDDEMGRACSTCGRSKIVNTKSQSKNIKKRNHLGDLGVDGKIILKLILKKQGVRMQTGLKWLRRGICGELPTTATTPSKVL